MPAPGSAEAIRASPPALAGGSTPRATYELLASDEFATRIDWAKVQVFFGDERCVPPEHAESNCRMARESLLSKVPIPGSVVEAHGLLFEAESTAGRRNRIGTVLIRPVLGLADESERPRGVAGDRIR